MQIDKSSWEKVKLIDVVTKKEENDKENAKNRFERFIKVEHLDAESLHIKRWGNQGKDELPPTFYKVFRKGQVLFPTRNPHLRRTALASFDGICGEKTLTLDTNEEKVLSVFLPFLFHSNGFYQHTTSSIVGSTNPHVRWRDVADYEFLLPPKDQQEKLAELLWAMEEVVKKEVDVLLKLKLAYLVKIEKQLLNNNSKKTYLRDLGVTIRGVGFKPNELLDNYSDTACLILRSNNISDAKINFDKVISLPLSNVKNNQRLKLGDFAICMSNGSKDLVGKSAKIIESTFNNISIGSFCAGFRANDKLSEQLLEHLFASESYRQIIRRLLSGSAINNLKPSDIEGVYFRLDEQMISRSLLELEILKTNIKNTEIAISEAKSLKKSLINQIF